MRQIASLAHPQCQITLYSWNNRYIIKYEAGLLEQTYKVDQFDVTSEADIQAIMNDTLFLDFVLQNFSQMRQQLGQVLERV